MICRIPRGTTTHGKTPSTASVFRTGVIRARGVKMRVVSLSVRRIQRVAVRPRPYAAAVIDDSAALSRSRSPALTWSMAS